MSWWLLRARALSALVLIATLGGLACAEEAIGDKAAASDKDPTGNKALKYHQLLVARPEPGYLFDRFYNTWLDESTVDSLEAFLIGRSAASGGTADRLLLAFFYVKTGNDVVALEKFREAVEANPASAAIWFHKAGVEARTLEFDQAISDLKTARQRSPDAKLAVRIEKQLGTLLIRNRQSAEAIKVLQALLAAHPDDDELAEELTDLYLDEGLFKEAAELSESLLTRTKDPYLAVMRRLRLGDIHHRAGIREKAITVYTASLEDVGADTWLEREILAQLDQVLRREDDLTGLKRLYDDLAAKYPKRIAIHRRRAQLLLELGENDAGLAAFREVLKLTPGHRPTREEYVTILAKIGSLDEAIKEVKSLCEQNPTDAELRFRLAGLLEEGKQTEETPAAVDDYLNVSDGSEYAYLRAARLLERLENKASARDVYDRLAKRFPESPSAVEAYAAFLYTQGQKEEAIARWRSLAKKAEVAQVLHVARALSARGEHQTALDLLRSRESEFAREPLFLTQLVNTSLMLKKYDDAIPSALALVELAQTPTDLETAIEHAAATIERADKLEEAARQQAANTDRSTQATCLLAELWERAGDGNRADEVLKKAAADGNLLAVSQQIRIYSQRRDWTAAADATRRILGLPEGRKSLYVRRLVDLYQRDFQLEEGLKWIQEWKRLSPGSTTPWVTEARMLGMLGKSDEALKVLRTAVLQFEDDEELRVRLAEFYGQSGKYADAERIYWQLYEQNEDLNGKLRWAQELGKLAQQQGNVQQIADSFSQRAQSNRRSTVPLLALAEVYRQTGDFEGRRRALTAAAKIKSDDIFLLTLVARSEEQNGDWQAAVATLQRAVPLDNTNRTRRQIAQLHLQYGNEETGLSMLLELAGGAEADPRAIEAAADALCAMGQWQRAAEFLQQRIADHPADYRLRYLLAVALEESAQTSGQGEERQPSAAIEQFLQLLVDQEELPAKKTASGSAQPNSSYYAMMQQLMPPQSAEWFDLLQHRYTSYAHRQQRGFSTPQAVGGLQGMRSAVQLPASVDLIRPMALTHLLSIATTLDDDQQQELYRTLESHGLKDAKALAGIDPTRGDISAALTTILEDEPDNQTALAILVVQRSGRYENASPDHLRRAVKIFNESRPQLAFMAAVQAGVQEAAAIAAVDPATADAGNDYLDQALKIAAMIDKPNPIVVMGLTTAMGGAPGRATNVEIGEKYRQRFSRLLVDWYPQLVSSPYGNYAFYLVIQVYSQSSDPAAYIRFLDEEVSRFQVGNPTARAGAALLRSGPAIRPTLLAPPTFPPAQLASFPPNVLGLFSRSGNVSPFGGAMVLPGSDPDSAEKIKQWLDKVKSPVLRVLLAHWIELKDEADEAIGKLLAAKTPTIDAYLLAASRAAEKDDFVTAVQLLEKARYLPMNQEIGRQVDGSIVASVLALKEDARKADPNLMESGRQASLRLRRARLDPQQRAELITAMESLGLEKEAKKFDELAGPNRSGSMIPSRSFAIAAPAASGTNPRDRIEKLLADKKTDAAVRLLVGEVTSQVQMALASPQNIRSMRRQFDELKQRIASFNLTGPVLDALAPGETTNVRRISEYATACQLFGKSDEARTQFAKALKLRPKDDQVRLQLILLTGPANPAACADEIRLLSKSGRENLGLALADSMQDFDSPFAERLGMAEIVATLIGAIDDADFTQSYWIEYIPHVVGRQMFMNRTGTMLPSLYAREHDAQRVGRRIADQGTIDNREKAHSRLCTAILEKPAVARVGFRNLLAASEAQGRPTEELVERAKKILNDEAERPARMPAVQQQLRYTAGSQSSEVRFRDPEEVVVRSAWKGGDWSLIDEILLPKLRAGKTTQQSARKLEQIATLYRCEPEKFLDEAGNMARRFRPLHPQQENLDLAIAVDVAIDRALTVDIGQIILQQLKVEANNQNMYQPPGYLVRYLTAAGANWDRQRQLEFLEQAVTIYIGPPEKRDAFLKSNSTRNVRMPVPMNQKTQALSQLLDQLLRERKWWFTVLRHLHGYETSPAMNLEYGIQSSIAGVVGRGAKETIAMLDESSWLSDLDKFETLSIPGSSGRWPLFIVLQQLASNAAVAEEVRILLEERQAAQPTFGTGLIIASLQQREKDPRVIEFVGGRLDTLKQLPEDRQQELAGLLRMLIGRAGIDTAALSPSAIAAREWAIGSQARRHKTLIEKVHKAKRLEDLGIQDSRIEQFVEQNMREVVEIDPAGAAKVILRLVELSRESQRRGQWNRFLGSGDSTQGSLLSNATYRLNTDTWSAYCFLVDVLRNDAGKHFEISHGPEQLMRESVLNALNRAPKGPKGQQSPVVQRVQWLYGECGPALAGRPSSLLIPCLYQQLQGQLSEKNSSTLREWAKQEKDGGKYPELAQTLDTVAAMIAAEKGKQKLKPGERRPAADYHQHFIELLGDQTLPLTWRLHLAQFISSREGAALPLELAQATVAVHAAALDAVAPIPEGQNQQLTQVAASLAKEKVAGQKLDDWRAKWAARYLKPRRPSLGPSTGQYENLTDLSTAEVICAALEVYFGADDMDRSELLLRKYAPQIGSVPSTLAIVVRAEKPEKAAELLRQNWQKLQFEWPDTPASIYDARLAELLPAVYDLLSEPDVRYFAQLFFASMRDAKADQSADVTKGPTRDERLKELAAKFSDVDFADPARRRRCLVLLSNSTLTRNLLAEAVTQEYSMQRVVTAFQSREDPPQLTQETELAACHFRNRLRAGDCQPLVELLKNLNASSAADDYRLGERLNPFFICCRDVLREPGPTWSQEECAALAAELRNLLKNREVINLNDYQAFNVLLVAMHGQAGHADFEWVSTVSDNIRVQTSSGLTDDIWKFGRRLNDPASDADASLRARYLQSVLKQLVAWQWIRWNRTNPYRIEGIRNDTVFRSVEKSGLLTAPEIKQHGEKVVEAVDSPPLVTASLAAWMQSAGDNDKATSLWKSVIDAEIKPDAKNLTELQTSYVVGLGTCLQRLGRLDEARAALSTADGKRIPDSMKGAVQKLRTALEQAPQPKEKGNPTDADKKLSDKQQPAAKDH